MQRALELFPEAQQLAALPRGGKVSQQGQSQRQ
jgi:hypothetical protein